MAVNAVVILACNDLRTDGLVGIGQHKAFRSLCLQNVIHAGSQVFKHDEAIAGGARLAGHIDRIIHRLLAFFIIIDAELGAVERLILSLIVVTMHLVQPQAAGQGVGDVQAVHRRSVFSGHILFCHGIDILVAVGIVFVQAGCSPGPLIGILVEPGDGGLGVKRPCIPSLNGTIDGQLHVAGALARSVAGVVPDLLALQGDLLFVDKGCIVSGVDLAVCANGDDLVPHVLSHVDGNRTLIADGITIGRRNFLDIVGLIIVVELQDQAFIDSHAVAVGGHGANQVGHRALPIAVVVDAKHSTLQGLAGIALLFDTDAEGAGVLFVGNLAFRFDRRGAILVILTLGLNGLAALNLHLNDLGAEVVVLQGSNFFHPIFARRKGLGGGFAIFIGGHGGHQLILFAFLLGINAEHSALQGNVVRHDFPTAGIPNILSPVITHAGLFQGDIAGVHGHPGVAVGAGHGALVDFRALLVADSLGDQRAVGRAAMALVAANLDVGRRSKQGTAVLRGRVDRAFKRLIDAVVLVNKVIQHTVRGAAVFLAPFRLAGGTCLVDIQLQRVGQHGHLAGFGGADHIDHNIFILGNQEFLLADGILQSSFVKLPVVQVNSINGNNIAVLILGAGNGGVAVGGGLRVHQGAGGGGVALDHAAVDVAQFPGELVGLLQQLRRLVGFCGGGQVKVVLVVKTAIIESALFGFGIVFVINIVFKLFVFDITVAVLILNKHTGTRVFRLGLEISISAVGHVHIIAGLFPLAVFVLHPLFYHQANAGAEFNGGIVHLGVVELQTSLIINVANHAAHIAAARGRAGQVGAVSHHQAVAVGFAFVHNNILAVGILRHLADIEVLIQVGTFLVQLPFQLSLVGGLVNSNHCAAAHGHFAAVGHKQGKLHSLQGFPRRGRHRSQHSAYLAVEVGGLGVEEGLCYALNKLVNKHAGFGVVELLILFSHNTVIQRVSKSVEKIIDGQLVNGFCLCHRHTLQCKHQGQHQHKCNLQLLQHKPIPSKEQICT